MSQLKTEKRVNWEHQSVLGLITKRGIKLQLTAGHIHCLASNKLTVHTCTKEHVYCFLLSCNKSKRFSCLLRLQDFKLSHVNLCYLPASSFMKTVGFSMMMSQCPSSMGWKSSSVYVCSSAYLQKQHIRPTQYCKLSALTWYRWHTVEKTNITSPKHSTFKLWFPFLLKLPCCSHCTTPLSVNDKNAIEPARTRT